MAGYLGTKAVLLSTTAANVVGNATISGDLTVDTDTLYVDSTNNRVGIGETSPDAALHVNSGTVNTVAKFHSTDSTASIYLTDGSTTGGDAGVQGLLATGDNLEVRGLNSVILATGTTDRLTIDSSGNLLVGKTASDFNTQGFEINSGGQLRNSRASGSVAFLNRKTDDGSIVDFGKDGTVVGTIGSEGGGGTFYIGSGDVSLAFNATSDIIFPRGTNAANRTDAISLGNANNRFKDLHLSGNAYIGENVYSPTGNIAGKSFGTPNSILQGNTTYWVKIFERHFRASSGFEFSFFQLDFSHAGSTNNAYAFGSIGIATKQQGTADLAGMRLFNSYNNTGRVAFKKSSTGGNYSGGIFEVWVRPPNGYCKTACTAFVNTSAFPDDISGLPMAVSTGSTTQPSGSAIASATSTA